MDFSWNSLSGFRGVLVSMNFGYFGTSRFARFHCNSMGIEITTYMNLHGLK